jgi:hypothetical protein
MAVMGIDRNTGIRLTGFMKVTVEVPDDIYRQVKAKSAMEGWSVREVATTLFRAWVAPSGPGSAGKGSQAAGERGSADPPWFGALRPYARRAKGQYGMDAIRRSIARGRAGETRP